MNNKKKDAVWFVSTGCTLFPLILFLISLVALVPVIYKFINTNLTKSKESKVFIAQSLDEAKSQCIQDANDYINSIAKINKRFYPSAGPLLSNKYRQYENIKVDCSETELADYGKKMNRKLGITKGKTCLINGKINVLLTQLIPNEDSVGDPEWDQPRETFFPIRSIYYSCDE
tara:strand:+ start:87 stop:605 length:519 start_codon:yes stop_codon:yes gene_type:complete